MPRPWESRTSTRAPTTSCRSQSTTADSPWVAAPARWAIFPITSFQAADDVDILRGKHQIAFGVDFLRTRDVQDNHYQDNGVFNFSGQYSNDPLLDFLTGKMNSFSQSGPQLNDLRQNVVGLYVQDTYHVTPQAGGQFRPALGADAARSTTTTIAAARFPARLSTPGQVSQVYANAPAGSLFYGDPGISNSFTDRRLANFSPRLGFVYNPDGSGQDDLPGRRGTPLRLGRDLHSVPHGRAESALRSSGHHHQRPLPVQQSVGQRAGRQSVPAPGAGQECRLPAGQCGGVSAAASPSPERGAMECQRAAPLQRQLGLFHLLPGQQDVPPVDRQRNSTRPFTFPAPAAAPPARPPATRRPGASCRWRIPRPANTIPR